MPTIPTEQYVQHNESRRPIKLARDHYELMDDCRSMSHRINGKGIPSRPEILRRALRVYRNYLSKRTQ